MPHHRSDKLPLYGLLLVLAFLGALAHAAPQFPTLTGRVVDDAGVLSEPTRRALESTLAKHEADTSNQVVVVTIKDLQGYDIADYGYQLGRHWGIGQAGRDNGALLIVAPKERKVRIEVGYGLEGTLTDAIAHNIVQTIILPKFRQHDFDGGVRAGVEAMLAAIAGTYKPLPQKRAGKHGGGDFVPFVILAILLGQFFHGIFRSPLVSGGVLGTVTGALVWLVMGSVAFAVLAALLVFLFHLFFMGGGGGGSGRGPWGGGYYGGTYGGGGFSGGGFGGGGGFSGGGGGFGGGGASGGW